MTLRGRPVPSLSDLEQPGDYVPLFGPDQNVSSLWFVMPEGTQGRIAGKGYGHPKTFGGEIEPEWAVTVHDDGTVTVDPSIDFPGHWHGHLLGGVWSW